VYVSAAGVAIASLLARAAGADGNVQKTAQAANPRGRRSVTCST
jgi:hypothetical protein